LNQITLNVDAKETTRSLKRRITGTYVDGFDVIKLKAVDNFTGEQQDAIREITDALFGLEIVEVTSNMNHDSMPINEDTAHREDESENS